MKEFIEKLEKFIEREERKYPSHDTSLENF